MGAKRGEILRGRRPGGDGDDGTSKANPAMGRRGQWRWSAHNGSPRGAATALCFLFCANVQLDWARSLFYCTALHRRIFVCCVSTSCMSAPIYRTNWRSMAHARISSLRSYSPQIQSTRLLHPSSTGGPKINTMGSGCPTLLLGHQSSSKTFSAKETDSPVLLGYFF